MGVTLSSKNYSIDLGYSGFYGLRQKVAELSHEELGLHYKFLNQGLFLQNTDKEKFYEEYNKKLNQLIEKFKIKEGILDFLYASDCSGVAKDCKEIYEVIKDYDDEIRYGYCGREDCARFKDFKRIVKDCIDNKYNMEWY